ncbi:MAG: hypothetical protein HC809_02995 [Gammaproteobacteria bacterium]|nr:hypothetical protein [Gammaproteobacteria bacterium]
MTLSLNGVAVSGTSLAALATSINSVSGLGTVSAALNGSGDLVVTDQVGNDLAFAVTAGGGADSLLVRGTAGAPVTLSLGGNPAAAIGGSVNFTFQEGVTMSNPVPGNSNLFGSLAPSSFTPFQLNTFDPTNQDTYNSATSMTVFDSLGNPHVMSMYFVKERFTPGVPGEEPNRWSMYALIDGRDVGDPDPNLPPPQNSEATRARFDVQFNSDGSINPAVRMRSWSRTGFRSMRTAYPTDRLARRTHWRAVRCLSRNRPSVRTSRCAWARRPSTAASLRSAGSIRTDTPQVSCRVSTSTCAA